MLILSETVALIGYLLPMAIWLALRWPPPARAPGGALLAAAVEAGGDAATAIAAEWAIELPVALALDFLVVLLLARVFTLEVATLVSRAAWIVGGGIICARRHRAGWRPRWPGATASLRWLAPLVGAAAAGVLLSLRLSRPFAIWDREWHIPLVSSLRGQRLPFTNVFDPPIGLFYHYAGDVQAAMLQTLSGVRLHASLALSLAHDVMFALIALNVVLFMRAFGVGRLALALVVFAGVVTIGPVTLLGDDPRKAELGFTMVNLLTLSFRPHVPLAYLMELGLIETLVIGLLALRPASLWRGRAVRLAVITGFFTLCDESSLGVLGLSMGALWLFEPRVLAPSRRAGLIVLGGLVASIALVVVCFGGSFAPGAPHYHMAWVAPRAPGFVKQSLSLSSSAGRAVLFQDLLPVLGVLAALASMAARERDRGLVGLTIFFAMAVTTSTTTLACFDYEGRASESHRFVTAMFAMAPFVAAIALGRRARVASPAAAAGGLAALLVYASLGLGVASTVEWLEGGIALRQCAPLFYGWRSDKFFDVDCRRDTGATLGERPAQTYVDSLGFYLWAGCHPIYAPASPVGPRGHKIKVAGPWYGRPAVDQLRATVPRTDSLPIVCVADRAAGPTKDVVCRQLAALAGCTAIDTSFRVCHLDGPARDLLSGKL